MWIDTHCHFDVSDFDQDRVEVAKQAKAAGVEAIVVVAYLAQHWPNLLAVCASIHEPKLLPVLGLHPCYIAEHQHEHLLQLEQYLQQHACIAIGEIGLDTYVADIKVKNCIKNSRVFLAHNCN